MWTTTPKFPQIAVCEPSCRLWRCSRRLRLNKGAQFDAAAHSCSPTRLLTNTNRYVPLRLPQETLLGLKKMKGPDPSNPSRLPQIGPNSRLKIGHLPSLEGDKSGS